LTLRIRNVETDGIGAFLHVDGKTGKRKVRIIHSVPLLSVWLSLHPFSKNSDACLWTKFEGNRYSCAVDAPIRPPWAENLLQKLAKKAGIKKRVYPHLFRHSRATHLAPFLTESLLKQHMGWMPDSEMTATYVHLSGQELDDALKRLSGLKVEKEEKSVTKLVKCDR